MPIVYKEQTEEDQVGPAPRGANQKPKRKKGGALGKIGRAIKKQFKHASGDKCDEQTHQKPENKKNQRRGRSHGVPPVSSRSRERARDANEQMRQMKRVERAQQLLRQPQMAYPATISSPGGHSLNEHYQELVNRVASASNKSYGSNEISSQEFKPRKRMVPKTRHPHGITMVSARRSTVASSAPTATKTLLAQKTSKTMMRPRHSMDSSGEHRIRRRSPSSHSSDHDEPGHQEDQHTVTDEEESSASQDDDSEDQHRQSLRHQSSRSSASSATSTMSERNQPKRMPKLESPEASPRHHKLIHGQISRQQSNSSSRKTLRRRTDSSSEREKMHFSRVSGMTPSDLCDAELRKPSSRQSSCSKRSIRHRESSPGDVVIVPRAEEARFGSTASLITEATTVTIPEMADAICQTDAYLWYEEAPEHENGDPCKDRGLGGTAAIVVFNIIIEALRGLRDLCLCRRKVRQAKEED